MGLISKAVERREITWRPQSIADLDRQMDAVFTGLPTASGVPISEESALCNTAYWNAIKLISETFSSVPLDLFRRLPRGKSKAVDNPLFDLVHQQPNSEMTKLQFLEAQQAVILSWGNAYAEIEWDMSVGRPVALWPLWPDRVKPTRQNGTLVYEVKVSPDETRILPKWRMLHVPGFGYNGIMGFSPVSLHRQGIGLGIAMETFGSTFFGNGAKPGGYLEHPGKLSDEAHKRLKENWNNAQQGLTNAQRTAILEEGMKYTQLGIPPDDAQFLGSREFQVQEIARIFNVPPSMLADLSHGTFSNIEQLSLNFVTYTMRPWWERWEQSFNWKLLGPDERKLFFFEFNAEGLLRGDSAARSEFYRTLFGIGTMSPNDIREKENMNPISGGDTYYVPLNMVSVGGTMPTALEDQDADDGDLVRLPTAPAMRLLSEGREAKKATARFALRASFMEMFRDMALRLIRAERREVMKLARRELRGQQEFIQEVTTYYDETFPAVARKQSGPSIRSLMEAIAAVAFSEIGEPDRLTPEMERFISDYVDGFVRRYIQSSRNQIVSIVQEAEAEEDKVQALDTRFAEWEERRPNKVAHRETVQGSNAMAKLIFVGAGISMTWVASGSDPCPYCLEMDGRTLGPGGGTYVQKGEGVTPEGELALKPSSEIGHPPLHDACECQLVPA